MEATILKGDTVLGTGVIQHLDPPMGVAFGPFTPSRRYSAYLHANTMDGEYLGDKATDFNALVDGAPVQAAAIAIEDWSKSLGEFHFTIWFREGKEYDPLFRDHADFKAYYPDAR
ncbi:hypothetical protein SAMN05428950_102517 [Sphingomonas sp. OV641]|uniref:hypothetical protein n=1 Tax=unclassified Sphingomonas TaxID=196159 RepID=UPI00083778AC|nr:MULTISPECIES: hypothetical protein [unclassified Sphingomonas]SEJ67760.1 hypothetical protein SAMN05428950_102517 [Sphingomonas sp. OV641]